MLAAVAVVVAVGLLRDVPGPSPSVAAAADGRSAGVPPAPRETVVGPRSAPRGFPAPPAGAVVYSRQDGARVLALGLVPSGGRLTLQASVIDGQGRGLRGLNVGFTVRGGGTASEAAGRPCGAGCYRARIVASARPQAVTTSIAGAGTTATRWTISPPAVWPPPDGSSLVVRAARVWRRLRTVVFQDHLASDARFAIDTRWTIIAPDRVTYAVAGGSSAIVIGDKRWDREPGGRWIESAQIPRLRQPLPFWVGVSDAHILARTTLRGRPVWDISFFDPRTPAWFEVLLDRRTLRTLDLRMNTTAHFMHDTYGPFNARLAIEPPS